MTHATTTIQQGKVQFPGMQPVKCPVKIRTTQRVMYFIQGKTCKTYLSEELAFDPHYQPDQPIQREVMEVKERQYLNRQENGELTWADPEEGIYIFRN